MGFHRHLPAPTAAEKKRWTRIKESGCIACMMRGISEVYPEIHHQTQTGRNGGKALGHRVTVGLCPWHHRGQCPLDVSVAAMEAIYGPSLSRTPRLFRETFGEDAAMLDYQDEVIGESRYDASEP